LAALRAAKLSPPLHGPWIEPEVPDGLRVFVRAHGAVNRQRRSARHPVKGEADGLACDEVLSSGRGPGLPGDQIQVDGWGAAVATVACDRDTGDGLAGMGGAQVDVASERPLPVTVCRSTSRVSGHCR
jgi:hypothetical protein